MVERDDGLQPPLNRVKQLFGESLTLRDYDGMATVGVLNKMTLAGVPESCSYYRDVGSKSDLFNNGCTHLK